MAYYRKDLTVEVNAVIEAKLTVGDPVVVAWLVQAILAAHVESDLSDFSQCARYEFVNDEVSRCVRRFKDPKPDELEQLVLPGFKHLQKAYRIERSGDTAIVPVDQMTDFELLAKADEHDVMAKGHTKHAREIRRYVEQRRQARAS